MFNYEEFSKNNNIELKEKLKKEMEEWDNQFYQEKMYKPDYHIANKRNRKVLTEYGEIIFFRREYKHKITKQRVSFADRHFGLQPHKNITYNLKNMVFQKIENGKTISSIKENLSTAKISCTSISRIWSETKIMYADPSNFVKKK